MKVVLDANVLIAALISRGVCCDLLEHCVMRHELYASEPILDDVQKHLIGKFKYTDGEAKEARDLPASQMTSEVPHEMEHAICRDPDDDVVLGTAVTAAANCIVTGDKDLLILQQYAAVRL